jgi:hypothetical protein
MNTRALFIAACGVAIVSSTAPVSAQVQQVPAAQQVIVQPGTIKLEPPKVVVRPDATVVIVNTQTLKVDPSIIPSSPATIQVRSGEVAAPQASGPICGGIVGGKPQPACGAKPARFESKAVGSCPAGSFFDVGLWQCWSCPSDYGRTLAAVTTERACSKPDKNVRGEFGAAQFKGTLCPAGSTFDPIRDGECWSCPSGFTRSVFRVDAPNACHQPARDQLFQAVRYNKGTGLLGTDCPGGQFWDGIDGYCYSCPNGRRTTASVKASDACARTVSEAWDKAKVVKKAGCEPGEIQDPRNGGECWRCPQSWDRTIFPVNGGQACEKGGGVVFAKAALVSSLTCPAGQLFDFIDGGTCWSCPAGYKRSLDAVKSPTACLAGSMDWFTAPYPQPGLFGLPGGEAAALEIVRERTLLEDAFEEVARGLGKPLADVRARGWSEIAKEPENSSVLRAVVLARMVAVLQGRAAATPAQQQLAAAFAEHVRQYRGYMAKNALDAYDAWKAADDYFRRDAATRPQSLQVLFDYGTVPPDFHEILSTGTWVGLAAGGAFGTMATITLAQPAVNRAVFPFARRAAKRAVEKAAMRAMDEGTKVVTKTVTTTTAKAGAQLGGDLVGAFLSAGPQIIITIAVEIISKAVEQMEEIQNARPKLVTLVATAAQPVDLKRMLSSDEGTDDLMAMWSLAVSGSARPTSATREAIAAIASK